MLVTCHHPAERDPLAAALVPWGTAAFSRESDLKPLTAVPNRLRPLLGLVLAACSGITGAAKPTAAEVAFERALARWRSAGMSSYSFKSSVICYCPIEYRDPRTVTVRNGAVVAVTNRLTGASESVGSRVSIDSLFILIRSELEARPANPQIEYDAGLGYPRSVKLGMPETDAGSFVFADSVVFLPR